MLSFLRSTLDASISMYLNPQTDLTDLPLKAFYRYALPEFEPGVSPASSSSPPGAPLAMLSRLPQKRVLTINMDVPEPWLVEPTQVETGLAAAWFGVDRFTPSSLSRVGGDVIGRSDLDVCGVAGGIVLTRGHPFL